MESKEKIVGGMEMATQTNKLCSICGKMYIGYGNNAMPVNEGVCCDNCNHNIVMPERLKELFGKNRK
jgi:DNA-directed RNA polymerase subunit RPC12/RpoP